MSIETKKELIEVFNEALEKARQYEGTGQDRSHWASKYGNMRTFIDDFVVMPEKAEFKIGNIVTVKGLKDSPILKIRKQLEDSRFVCTYFSVVQGFFSDACFYGSELEHVRID